MVSCRLSASPAEQLNETDSGSEIVSSPAASIFVMRDNPRQFFVRQPLPSTSSAQTASPAPSKQPEEAPPEDQPKSSSRTKSGGWWHVLMQIRPLSPWQDSCLIQLTQQGSHMHEKMYKQSFVLSTKAGVPLHCSITCRCRSKSKWRRSQQRQQGACSQWRCRQGGLKATEAEHSQQRPPH